MRPNAAGPQNRGLAAFCLLFSKIGGDFLHPRLLLHMEGAAGLAVAAFYTVTGLYGQLFVMSLCHLVSGQGQIVILVD